MKTIKCLALFMVLNVAALGITNSAEAAQNKNVGQKKNSTKNSSQWSADPELGWVRANEQQKSQDSDRRIRDGQNDRKPKGKNKGNKS